MINCHIMAIVAELERSAMKRFVVPCALAIGMALSISACTDPYDPGQRAVGGGLMGAGAGALVGGAVGGGRGAVAGAVIGGAGGAVAGAATTPQRPPPPGYYQQQPGYPPPPPAYNPY
jgi:predicted lipid-binding transport protein (Tim44 family)